VEIVPYRERCRAALSELSDAFAASDSRRVGQALVKCGYLGQAASAARLCRRAAAIGLSNTFRQEALWLPATSGAWRRRASSCAVAGVAVWGGTYARRRKDRQGGKVGSSARDLRLLGFRRSSHQDHARHLGETTVRGLVVPYLDCDRTRLIALIPSISPGPTTEQYTHWGFSSC
jgi:hypothetical protein